MIKTGKDHLEQLQDGRIVYIGDEKVSDVTKHPSLKRAAKTVARLYDLKHTKEHKNDLTYEENGDTFSTWFIQAKNKDDLRKRSKAHKIIADHTSGEKLLMSSVSKPPIASKDKFPNCSAVRLENGFSCVLAPIPPAPIIPISFALNPDMAARSKLAIFSGVIV